MHELTLIKASISTFACSKLRRTWYKIFQASIISSKKHKSQSTMEDIVSFNLYQDMQNNGFTDFKYVCMHS
jgi:hypothetical protein